MINVTIKMIGPFGDCFFETMPTVCPCGGIVSDPVIHLLGVTPPTCNDCKAIFTMEVKS